MRPTNILPAAVAERKEMSMATQAENMTGTQILLKYTGGLCSVSAELGELFVGTLMQILTFN